MSRAPNFSYEAETINVGFGSDVTIRELAELIADVVGFAGRIVQDRSRPDGTPRKLLDISRILELQWKPQISLQRGVRETYNWYKKNWYKKNRTMLRSR